MSPIPAVYTSYPSSLKSFPPEWLEQDQSSRLTRVAIGFGVAETIFAALFFYSRIRARTANGLDTYLMVPAYLASFSHIILCHLFIHVAGVGHHWPRLTPGQQVIVLKLEMALSMLNAPAITLPKLSILALYLRVFSSRPYRLAALFIAAMLIVAWIISAGLQMGMCVPFAYQWDKSIAGGHCLNEFQIFIWFGVPSIVTDLAIIAIPLPLIWRLQTSRNQKVGLTVTFLAGSVGIFTAIIRFAVFLRLLSANENPIDDLSWRGVDIIMWTTIEPGVYFIAACLPSLRPLFNPLLREVDIAALRTRFQIRGPKDVPNDIKYGNEGEMNLSGITAAVTSSVTARPRSPRTGFMKLSEPVWPARSFENGNKNSGLATCYRERDSEDGEGGPATSRTELQRSQYSYGIVVQKAYTISREPVR